VFECESGTGGQRDSVLAGLRRMMTKSLAWAFAVQAYGVAGDGQWAMVFDGWVFLLFWFESTHKLSWREYLYSLVCFYILQI